jgi:ABC-2 type transport system permease protein
LIIIGSWVLSLIIGLKCLPLLDIHLGDIDIFIIIKDPLYIISFILYFLTGFLLYSALLVGLGSVCNTVKELQHVWTPIMVAAIVPMMTLGFIVKDPNGQVARLLSYFPLWTPFIMMNRAGGPPPLIDYFFTSILMVVSLIAAFWGAGRIFRIGILMTGQPPKLKEILKWLAYPEGKTPVRKDK